MNILRRVYERLVDIATGTSLIEVELPEETREALGRLSELSGVKPSAVMRVLFRALSDPSLALALRRLQPRAASIVFKT